MLNGFQFPVILILKLSFVLVIFCPHVFGASQVLSVATRGQFVCALLSDQSVKCWGLNDHGQLGQGDMIQRGSKPNEMGEMLKGIDFGKEKVTAISVGSSHACVLLQNQTVKCWGQNYYGQLGLGDTEDRGDQPNEMGEALPAVDLGEVKPIAISVGGGHSCVLLQNQTVKCWGNNLSGQLGLKDNEYRGDQRGEMGSKLLSVDLGKDNKAIALSAGDTHNCVLLSDQNIKCWGGNYYGQLGLGDKMNRGDHIGEMGDGLPNVDLGKKLKAVSVSAGGKHTCVLLNDHTVKCWGRNYYGQLGQGDTNDRGDKTRLGNNLKPVDLGLDKKALAVSAGFQHTCSILNDQTVKCWGDNIYGTLGQGDDIDRGGLANQMGSNLKAVVVEVGLFTQFVSVGYEVTCVGLKPVGQIKCWGNNNFGQLGLGDTQARGDLPGTVPIRLPYIELD